MSAPGASPGVTVVVATRDRPEMVREAIASVVSQRYDGDLEVVLVFDGSEPDPTLASEDPSRRVRVTTNARRPGLAGARNTGISEARHEIVAFCDDDDLWEPDKLRHQVPLLLGSDAPLVTTGIRVAHGDTVTTRTLDVEVVTMSDLLRDRHMELHPSTFLMWRTALLSIGGVDEDVPGGFGEDYDLLLRAARVAPLRHVRLPLATIRWSGNSYFFQRWETMAAGLTWLLDTYPEFESQPAGAARVRGQIAFATAATRRRREALRWGLSAAARNPFEPRVALATLVALGLPARHVMAVLHSRGRGI